VEAEADPGQGVSLADIARKLKGAPGYAMPEGVSPGLEATSMYRQDSQVHASASHACELEVDTGTGQVNITRYVAVHDSGNLINPMIAEGQVVGAIVHGIGNALFEKMAYDDAAQPTSTTFADYLLPTSTEIPPIEVLFVQTPSRSNPIGVKGIGETGIIPVPALVMSAIEDALAEYRVHICEAPLSPVRLLELMDQGLASGQP
jgi:carbon-monoxide dehydrogenase large subunit